MSKLIQRAIEWENTNDPTKLAELVTCGSVHRAVCLALADRYIMELEDPERARARALIDQVLSSQTSFDRTSAIIVPEVANASVYYLIATRYILVRGSRNAELTSLHQANGEARNLLKARLPERIGQEDAITCAIIRDLVPNRFAPFRLEPEWFTRTVKQIASQIQQERSYFDLPILADCLEEAGCKCQLLLDHLRTPMMNKSDLPDTIKERFPVHLADCWGLVMIHHRILSSSELAPYPFRDVTRAMLRGKP